MTRPAAFLALTLALALSGAAGAQTPPASAQQAVKDALARIKAMDRAGPRLNAVIALNPAAADDAWALDAERRSGRVRSPLHGRPVLLKDNIDVAGLPTTAGSLALAANVATRDAALTARLRNGGAVILGKANLSEWANYRSSASISGWSAVGGLVRNPYALDRGACGSSSGSAVAVAVGYVDAAIGTETDGSITCPAATNGVVGFKPTLGLVSRAGIAPLSPQQDSAGPIARTVAEAAAVLTLIAGTDPADPMTRDADLHRTDYAAALGAGELQGVRIGVLRGFTRQSPATDAVFDQALARLTAAGAVLVEVPRPPQAQLDALGAAEGKALAAEFHAAIDAYLAAAPAAVKTRSLAALAAFNARTPRETALFGQDTFETALKAAPDPAARAAARRLAGPEGLDALFAAAKVEVLVAETGAPAPVVDPVNGSKFLGSPSTLPAVAGYPHLTVPMGEVSGLPVGLSIIGPAWSDARVLAIGYGFERLSPPRRAPMLAETVNARPEVARAFAGP